MINDNDLIGKAVMLHPQLWEKLAGKDEVIGLITRANISGDEFYVDHGGKQDSLYSSDAIVVLRDSNEMYDRLQNSAHRMSNADFRDVKNIALLLDHGSAPQVFAAMELARDNEHIHQAALVSLETSLARQATRTIGR